jgi:FG-GAP repeat
LFLKESIGIGELRGLIMRAGTGQAWPNLGGASVLLIFAALLFSSQLALAQFTQQGPKLVGNDAVNSPSPANQGQSVALSGDGNTAIVGGPGDNSAAGAVWVYTRSGGGWTQQGSKLVANDAVNSPYPAIQGQSVALSGDGNTAIVGGPDDNGGIGAAWVYTRSNGVWTQQGSKLVGTGAVNSPSANQGQSVALSGDGNTAIVGGPSDNFHVGAAWVYTRSNGVWTQQGGKLVGTGANGASQGYAVALSGDGNTAIVGGPFGNAVGAAWVFIRSGGVWTQQGSKLVGTGGTGQGYSVALSADGNTAMVGGPEDGNGAGAAWLYTRSNGVWTQQGSKLVANDAIGNAGQGRSVSLSADGNTAIVGGPVDNNFTGAAWVYTRSNGVWTQQGNKLVGTGAAGPYGASQGISVALSGDGNTAIVGGYFDNGYAGAAWVFVQSAGALIVSPATNILASGIQGEAFSPASFQYQLSSTPWLGPAPLSRAGCSCQFGRASAPMIPQRVQTMRGPNDGTGT